MPGTAWKWASICVAIIIANPKPLFISNACCTRPRPCALKIRTRWWTRVTAELPIALAPEQLEAVRTAARSKVMVLTGRPRHGQDHHHQRDHQIVR